MEEITEIVRTIPISHYILLCSVLFCIGVAGVLLRRNAIIILMSIELMLNAVNLLMVVFASYRGDSAGQVFVFFIMIVAAAEVAIGLAIIMMTYRNLHTIDVDFLKKLRG